MKKNLLCFLLIIPGFYLIAQQPKHSALYDLVTEKSNRNARFVDLDIFKEEGRENITGIIINCIKISVNKTAATAAFVSKSELVNINIPFSGKNYLLRLSAVPINSTGDFSFGIIENGVHKKLSTEQGLHYRGYIDGDPFSMACISFFENGEVMGVFCNKEGNFNIGRKDNGTGDYVVYNSRDLITPPRYACGTAELPVSSGKAAALQNNSTAALPSSPLTAPALLCNKVRLYWEADNRLYVNNFGSSLANTKNYITGVFNVVASVYQNEGITIELSDSYVWTTVDPYSNASSSAGLAGFKARWNALGDNFKADLAHLVAGGPSNNGGVAYLLNFDQCNRPYAYGYSNVYASYQALPAYSWDVEVLSHETGHNFGSNHTQWCGWNTGPSGTCGSIDNCYAQETAGACTTCPTTTNISTAPPGFKGTIMSYCHLVSGIGIDLMNGFGPLPQAVIRNNINVAACLTQGSSWTGSVNTAWENAGNWSCGTIPTVTTDIVIGTGLANYPVVNSSATCRSIKQSPNANVHVNAGFTLKIVGPPF
ncbi:MAG: M12 family metallo-peptidase [Ferruginibacter sp.]